MKILHEKPPEWIMSGCLSQFRVNVDRTFWTYGDIIYNPGGIELRDDIVAHEEQHMRQQAAYIDVCEVNEMGMTCEAHYGLPFEHDPECPGPGMFPSKGKDAWWARYLAEPRFRLEQEAEAYGVQYKYICKHVVSDRNKRAKWLHMLAGQLSGPLYQVAVTHAQAKQMIEILAGTKKLPKEAIPPEFKPV